MPMTMMIRLPTAFLVVVVVTSNWIAEANGFVLPSPILCRRPTCSGTATATATATAIRNEWILHYSHSESTGWDSFKTLRNSTNVPSGEEQRKYRRTVYSHKDWRKHRSPDRFIYFLLAIFKSGVYKNLGREVLATTLVAIFVILYNALGGGYTDFSGVDHAGFSQLVPKLTLPLAAFTLTSPSLGLLLVFRTNTSYQRWDEARKNWGMNINHTRDLVRMANCYYDDTGISPVQRADDLNHVALCTWAFVRAMYRHLSPEDEDEENFREELYEKLPQRQAEMIISASHRPNRALQDLSYAIDNLPMHFMRKNEIHGAVTIFEDTLGSSERILSSPVPLFYSRHLARFLAVWLLLLPFGMYDSFAQSWNHLAMVPATAVISVMLFGIEEIGTQLEEPFTVLPMQAFCDKIFTWCMEIAKWVPGDNGRPMRPVKPEHAYFTDSPLSPAMYGQSYQPYLPPQGMVSIPRDPAWQSPNGQRSYNSGNVRNQGQNSYYSDVPINGSYPKKDQDWSPTPSSEYSSRPIQQYSPVSFDEYRTQSVPASAVQPSQESFVEFLKDQGNPNQLADTPIINGGYEQTRQQVNTYHQQSSQPSPSNEYTAPTSPTSPSLNSQLSFIEFLKHQARGS